MIKTVIPIDKNFDYRECKKMFEENKQLIGDNQSFKDIVRNTYFYSFYKNNTFLGCIYCYYKGEKLFLNGFAGRHHHKENMECMKLVLSWFNCDIYAESIRKPAIYCLKILGFKKIKENLYKYER